MIDSRDSPTVAACDFPSCDVTFPNSDDLGLVAFQDQLADAGWSWAVDYSVVWTRCPQHPSAIAALLAAPAPPGLELRFGCPLCGARFPRPDYRCFGGWPDAGDTAPHDGELVQELDA